MALTLNRGFTGTLFPPGGYPVRLAANTETEVLAMMHRRATSVTASVQASKTATVNMGLFYAPAAFTLQTGTVSSTSGNRKVTGSGTSFSAAWVGQELQAAQTWRLRIARVVSTTELYLDDVAPTTASGQTFYTGSSQTAVVDRDDNGDIVKTYSANASITSIESDISVTFPITDERPPRSYLLRLWVSDITGDTFDDIFRSSAVTSVTAEPKIVGHVLINSMRIA